MIPEFKSIAEDLLRLEVNTIVKKSGTGASMPHNRRIALYVIATEYHAALSAMLIKDFDPNLAKYFEHNGLGSTFRDPVYWHSAGLRSFGELRDRAQRGLKSIEVLRKKGALTEEQERKITNYTWRLMRICEHSSHLVGLFRDLAQASGVGENSLPNRMPPGFEVTLHSVRTGSQLPEGSKDRYDLPQLLSDYTVLDQDSLSRFTAPAALASTTKSPAEQPLPDQITTALIRSGLVGLQPPAPPAPDAPDTGRKNLQVAKRTLPTVDTPVRSLKTRLLQPFKKGARPHAPDDWNNDLPLTGMNDERLSSLKLSPHHLTIIRKAWDLGMEQIVAQSIIQLSGDVTTRISEDLTPGLLSIHKENFGLAIDYWKLITEFLTALSKSLVAYFRH